MPKLYNSIKIHQGLKIGSRNPRGDEWFADMTFDRNKRTCRKLDLEFNPQDLNNLKLAKELAQTLFNDLKVTFALSNKSLNLTGWQTKTLTACLVLLWISGLTWISIEYLGATIFSSGQSINTLILGLHGMLIIPTLIALGGLWVAHMPNGWRPDKKKLSGIILILFISGLILTGFILFYVNSLPIKTLTSFSHSLLGLILIPLIYWHYRKRSIN